jgi:hypothetical protein
VCRFEAEGWFEGGHLVRVVSAAGLASTQWKGCTEVGNRLRNGSDVSSDVSSLKGGSEN